MLGVSQFFFFGRYLWLKIYLESHQISSKTTLKLEKIKTSKSRRNQIIKTPDNQQNQTQKLDY